MNAETYPKVKKYSNVITVDEQKAYVKILDKNKECLCEMTFDKNLLEQLGNRYDEDGLFSKDSMEVDDIFYTILMRVQEKFNLVERYKK